MMERVPERKDMDKCLKRLNKELVSIPFHYYFLSTIHFAHFKRPLFGHVNLVLHFFFLSRFDCTLKSVYNFGLKSIPTPCIE